MIRLYAVVEGQTEEQFVNKVLAPHLLNHAVVAVPLLVLKEGGGSWNRWDPFIRRTLSSKRGPDVAFTTLFDLYGLPRGFPGLSEHGSDPDTNRRCDLLERALGEHFGDRRLVPYLQRHEFEALVLAARDALREVLDPEERQGLDLLAAELGDTPPEDVNDGRTTAPSKRLEAHLRYQKTVHGPLAVEGAGLATLRRGCPRFDAWVTRLERSGRR